MDPAPKHFKAPHPQAYFFLIADFGCMTEAGPAAGFSLGCFGFLCSRLLLWPLAMLFSCADCVTWAAAFDYPHGNTGSGLLVTSRSRCRQSSCSSVTHPALCKRTAN